MGTSPKPTTWIGFGTIAVATLAAAFHLGRISAESDKKTQARQDAASKNEPYLQATLSVARKRLASCEKSLQRRDPQLQKREKAPRANEDESTPSPEQEPSEQCVIRSLVKELHTMATNCRNFRWQFNAYEEILGSNTIDCETILSIRDLAQAQHSNCIAVARSFEDASQPDITNNILGLDAMESAYMFRSDFGDVDVDGLVKNPECIARMQTE
ncbi:hypothetical protein [Sorangium atrum]|uniref:Secreted protein n=1 Tax=Sorangium atrum TaxID=2995308 RepID=A0ABT5C7H6_9BACT|nr:hypothetical protein [Sorangium aterium]MDC0681719.1 hypothetical protein [Sorangium aterium]